MWIRTCVFMMILFLPHRSVPLSEQQLHYLEPAWPCWSHTAPGRVLSNVRRSVCSMLQTSNGQNQRPLATKTFSERGNVFQLKKMFWSCWLQTLRGFEQVLNFFQNDDPSIYMFRRNRFNLSSIYSVQWNLNSKLNFIFKYIFKKTDIYPQCLVLSFFLSFFSNFFFMLFLNDKYLIISAGHNNHN